MANDAISRGGKVPSEFMNPTDSPARLHAVSGGWITIRGRWCSMKGICIFIRHSV